MTDLDYKGKVSGIDLDKKILIMLDEQGVTHPFKWITDAQQEFFAKQKPGYYLSLKYDDETRIIKSAHYWQEWKEEWKPANLGQGQKFQSKQRNEKPTIYQSSFKTCAELARDTDFSGMSYEQRVEMVRIQAEKIATWMMKGSGV